MKRNLLHFFAGLIIISVMMSSCETYEDGPSFTLVSATNRVANTWKIEKVFVNDVDRSSLFQALIDTYKVELTKDGELTETFTTSMGTHTNEGTWTFDSNKERIITTISGSTTSYKILRLKSSEMWLEEIDDGNKIVTHFVSYK